MKKIKYKNRLQIIILNIIMLICLVYLLPTHTQATEMNDDKRGDYVCDYNEKYDGMEIIEYNGTDKVVVIPEVIDGVPVKVIGEEVFKNKKDSFEPNKYLEEVIIPDTVLEIKEEAFFYCNKLKKVKLSKNLKVLGESAFGLCSQLKSIDLPKTISVLPEGVFSSSGLKEITIPANVVRIKSSAFFHSALTKVTFEKGSKLERIGTEAFEGCDKLKEINFPPSLLIIGGEAFMYCDNLKKVTFGNNSRLKVISYYAFAESDSLEKITLPKNVKKIDSSAFRNCKSLRKVVFKGKVPSIKRNVFKGIRKNATFKVPAKYKSKYKKKIKSRSWYKKTMKIV
ncbi:MAG: leucine-rich repeat domain-containing protein [Lachnospiraceae bacterium]|nr:leucine-rich repeat domain-containing protein [Lachnospiraceae bacterium]